MSRQHTEEFKRDAVNIALSSGLSRRRVAADLGIGLSTLSKWISKYGPLTNVSEPLGISDADIRFENERLRKENRILREEREVLKKATQFFAGQRR